jgi:fructokinase
MNLANSLGIINSFDANIPPDVEEKEKLAIQDAFKKSQIIKLNERELFYWSKDDLCQGIETVAQRFFERFELIVLLITLGAEGSLLVTARDVIHCPAIPVESICGVGAGDGYLAGVIHMLMKKTEANMSKDNLMRLSAEAWREVGMYGNAVGALVTTGYGAVPSMPRSEKVEGLLKSFGSLNRK